MPVVRENLDYVVWFTLVWSAVVGVLVAVSVGIFLFVRRQSRAEGGIDPATRHKSDVRSQK